MNCESCERDNVVRAYCFFKKRVVLFEYIYGEAFTVESFATFAIEMQLTWRYDISCEGMPNLQAHEYWSDIFPELKKALRESKPEG